MAIIVGDIHGNVEKTTRFLDYRPDQPHLALGDYVVVPEKVRYLLRRCLIEGGIVFPSRKMTVLLQAKIRGA